MLNQEFKFVQELKEDKQNWNYICKKFNEEFLMELKPTTLQKRYEREVGAQDAVAGNDVDRAVRMIKTEPIKPVELGRRLGLDLDGLEDLMDDLQNTRSAVKIHNGCYVFDRTHASPDDKKHKMDISLETGVWHKIGIIADTHYCSVHELPHLVEKFYSICEKEGVVAMLHAGDVTAGQGNVYKGQMQDLKVIGVDKQVNYVCSVYPMYSFPTYLINGNHDMDAFKMAGVDIVEMICDRRDDMYYVGKLGGYIDIDGVNIYMLHGDAGNPTARTFKMQKLIDNMPLDALPDIYILGHYHVVSHLPNYRGVIGVQPACFESQGDFLLRKGLYAEIGGCILNVMVADTDKGKRIVRHQLEFFDLSHYA